MLLAENGTLNYLSEVFSLETCLMTDVSRIVTENVEKSVTGHSEIKIIPANGNLLKKERQNNCIIWNFQN